MTEIPAGCAVSWFGRRSKYIVPGRVYAVGNDAWPTIGREFSDWCLTNLRPGEPRVIMFNAPDRPLWGGDAPHRVRSVADVRALYVPLAADLKAAGAIVVVDAEYDYTAAKGAMVREAIEQPFSDAGVPWTQWASFPLLARDGDFIPYEWSGQATPSTPHLGEAINDPCLYLWANAAGAQVQGPVGYVVWQTNKVRACLNAQPTVPCVPWLGSMVVAASGVDRETNRELMRHVACLNGLRAFAFDQSDDAGGRQGEEFDADFNAVADEFLDVCRGVPFARPLDVAHLRKTTGPLAISACELADGSVVGRMLTRTGSATSTTTNDLGGGRKLTFPASKARAQWQWLTA